MTAGVSAPGGLRVEHLHVNDIASGQPLLSDVSLRLQPGRTVGVVGQSGSGKSTLCKAILGILPARLRVCGGRITLDERDLLALDFHGWRSIRGRRIGAVFQEPAAYLNPSITVGQQLAEVIRVHHGAGREEARRRAKQWMGDVGLRDPELVHDQYPFELSGGMLQRIGIAMAMAGGPELLIADEPTTALDVTVQADILDLLAQLITQTGLGMLFVSHDLAVIAQISDTIMVMENGCVVETGAAADVLHRPQHSSTRALLAGHARYSIDRYLQPEHPDV